MTQKGQGDLRHWVESLITDSVASDPDNTLHLDSDEKCWAKPLIGFASGTDDYFPFFKRDIGEFFWLPVQAFQQGFPDLDVDPQELTVISWVIPHTRQIKLDHRKATRMPSERWSRARFYGESFNNKLRAYVRDQLTTSGYPAVSPMLLPSFSREDSKQYGYASTWSERHAAFVCGLGTFGLSDGLITPLGKAVRFGSVIAKIDIEATPRPYDDHHAYCLFYRDQSCNKCAERCPVGAISSDGHDKVKCSEYIRKETAPAIKTNYDLVVNACGLCQAKVPCESKIPKSSQLSD